MLDKAKTRSLNAPVYASIVFTLAGKASQKLYSGKFACLPVDLAKELDCPFNTDALYPNGISNLPKATQHPRPVLRLKSGDLTLPGLRAVRGCDGRRGAPGREAR